MADDLLDRIQSAAEVSIGRAAGFAGLAIGCVVLGLAGYPQLALRSGAALTLLAAAVLYLYALAAPTRSYRRTEAWLLLDRPDLAERVGQHLIGNALRSVSERYARWYAVAAVGLWIASLAWG